MRKVLVLLVLVAFVALTACNGGGPSATTANTKPPKPFSFLTLGGSATEGDGLQDRLHQAWPYLVFHHGLPISTTFVNGATDDGSAVSALSEQVPLASETKPDVAAVWIGADDLRAGTELELFRTALTRLVDGLEADGARRVVMADLPPAYGSQVARYNDVIRAVARATGADLVELAHTSIALSATGGLPPQPDAASHKLIAEAFERVLTAHGVTSAP